MTPFEQFVQGEFRRLRDNVSSGVVLSNGETIRSAPAETRGAYLLWRALGHDKAPVGVYFDRAVDDLFGVEVDEPDPPPRRRRVEKPASAPAKVESSDDPFAMFNDPEPDPFDI